MPLASGHKNFLPLSAAPKAQPRRDLQFRTGREIGWEIIWKMMVDKPSYSVYDIHMKGGVFVRVQVIMPDDLVASIDAAAKALNVSRSAFICMSVSIKIQQDKAVTMMPDMIKMMKELQEKQVSEDASGKQ